MKCTPRPLPPRSATALAVALLIGMTMLTNPADAATPVQHITTVAAHTTVDMRISSLHSRLQITAAQESLWQPVAQVMRDNATAMDTLRQSHTANAGSMSAVDDLKSYGQVADAHADGIRKLTPAFQALYDSMSDAQKKNADLIFRTDHQHSAKKG